jgi:hypothetical protein
MPVLSVFLLPPLVVLALPDENGKEESLKIYIIQYATTT